MLYLILSDPKIGSFWFTPCYCEHKMTVSRVTAITRVACFPKWMEYIKLKTTLQISEKKILQFASTWEASSPHQQVISEQLSLPPLQLTSFAPINRCKFTGPRSSSPRTTCSSPIFRPGLKQAKWSLIIIAWQLTMRSVKLGCSTNFIFLRDK